MLVDMRRHGPVQQWLESLPGEAEASKAVPQTYSEPETSQSNEVSEPSYSKQQPEKECVAEFASSEEQRRSSLAASTPRTTPARRRLVKERSVQSEGHSPRQRHPLLKDNSLQSDCSGSSASSVKDVLSSRTVNAESLLIALGFGPSERQEKLQRIPDRFLVPSKLRGISTEQFIKEEQHSMHIHDCGIFGYRGLTGSPHAPPSTIVAKIIERISQGDLFADETMREAILARQTSTPSKSGPPPVTTT